MKSSTFELEVNGTRLGGHSWSPDGEPRAAVVIAHGVGEHGARYERFATALADHGIATWAVDHRGHKLTAGTLERAGHVADRGGWALMLDDLRQVVRHVRFLHPELPLVLIGHSMGSLLARELVSQPPLLVDGLVISGPPGDEGLLGRAGVGLAASQVRLRGPQHRSKLLNRLTLGSNNAAFKPNRTDADWLSGVPEWVDAYVADPWCGFVCSTSFFLDLIKATTRVNSAQVYAATDRGLPILIVQGEDDPVGKNGKVAPLVAAGYSQAGIENVRLRMWPKGRHELLGDVMAQEVTDEIIDWIEDTTGIPAQSADRSAG